MLQSRKALTRSGRRTRAFRWVGVAAILVVASACGVGKWSLNSTPAPVRAVHAALLKNGHVLLIQGSGADPNLFAAGTFTTTEWDPVANTFRSIPTPYDMFCSGHAALPDGSLLVAGGTAAYPNTPGSLDYEGSPHAYRFNVSTHKYVKVPDLAEGHWYPTLVNRGDGKVIMVAGLDQNSVLQSHAQVFDPTANAGAGSWSPQQTTASFLPPYPALHLMADGRYLYSGVSTFGDGSDDAGIWDSTANTFTSVPGLTDRFRRDMGASVLLPPAQSQRVMVMGGGKHPDPAATAVASTAIIDLTQASPAFVAGPAMAETKQYVSAVVLPDRTVLQTGGTNESFLDRDLPSFQYRYTAQIFHPDTGQWEDAAKPTVGRTYHSEALLLPDGRVATFGGNASNTGADFEMRIELYTPDYVSKTRPVLTVGTNARAIARGGSTTFASDRPLKWVHLIRPGAATHSNDPDQRLVDLPFTQTGTSVAATLDANPNLTPPGWYMLFGVDTDGTPSVATWVHVT
jgi:Domain of unknown function (DUF1929)./Glyoxal oxidase N-terminus.